MLWNLMSKVVLFYICDHSQIMKTLQQFLILISETTQNYKLLQCATEIPFRRIQVVFIAFITCASVRKCANLNGW